MAKTIKEALNQEAEGFYIGTRLILPFKCQLLKLIIKGEIFTEMVGSDDIKIHQDAQNTSVYFRSSGNLSSSIDSYRSIKMIAAEEDADISKPETHIKLICKVKDDHLVLIEEPDEDTLFIE